MECCQPSPGNVGGEAASSSCSGTERQNSRLKRMPSSALSTAKLAVQPNAVHRPDNPIVCVDENFEPIGDFFKRGVCVRIRPDDWPAFADQAWTAIETAVSDAGLRAIVVNEDRERLDDLE